MDNKPKIIVILGPTSSGKSDIAIKLARKFNGEIISADSRQIYRGLDIGAGKEPGRVTRDAKHITYVSSDVSHYMIDIVSPRTNFSSGQFKKKADKIITDILKRGKLPIICGGTGFWIKAIVDNVSYPEVKPDWKLRKRLNKKSAEELFLELEKLDPKRAQNIDAKNKVRLIRAIEICKTIGKVPFVDSHSFVDSNRTYNFLQIGIDLPKETLRQRIKTRLEKRFEEGMIEEVRKLHFENKISWKRLESFGLGYFWIPKFLKGEIETKEELFEKIFQAEKDYAKRQLTWFQKDERIVWLRRYKDIENKLRYFLK